MQGATLSILGLYNWDNTIFDQIQLPAGINKTTLVNLTLADCAELEVIYTDPEFFKMILKSWSAARLPIWNRIANAAALEYDPIENYDRREEWTDSGEGNTTQTNKNRAYNQDAGLLETAETDTTGENSSTHSGRVHGNIGVTTSQQMLEQEVNIAEKLDVYNYIITDIRNRFCIPVW